MRTDWTYPGVVAPVILAGITLLATPSTTLAQVRVPTARLVPASPVTLPGEVDSNSPAVWALVEGRPRLHVLTSADGQPRVSSGARLTRMGGADPVGFVSHPGHGVWMEAVVADEDDVWYGYYHNEIPAELCGRPDRVIPRIGAARSADQGRTWQDLGIILEAPPAAQHCTSPNGYFVGGVGDLSVMLDQDSTDLYLFFSQYSRSPDIQGVAVARLVWANRDAPAGRVEVWSNGVWLPPSFEAGDPADPASDRWIHRAGTALVRPLRPWHDADPVTDAFWGASVHWNTSLQQYVMLLNRTRDEQWTQEGIYISFASALDDPRLWSPPQRLLAGGTWYPQVLGITAGEGTDKHAGAVARFFMGGVSTHLIEFTYQVR
jgi:hypothetical protein